MILQRTFDIYAGYYDFSVSTGAIGSIDLQIPVYANSCIVEFGTRTVATTTSATNIATISFDIKNLVTGTTFVGALLPATICTSFVGGFGIVPGMFLGSGTTPSIFVADTFSIGMSIAVEPLLTGKIQCWCRIISFDF